MNTHTLTNPSPRQRLKGTLQACTSLLVALMLSACGGGGGGGADSSTASNGVGVGGTGVAAGPVSGFGSIIVNGVRFDDSTARVLDDDDQSGGTIKLGMMVQIESGSITPALADTLGSATAKQIVYSSSVKGKVTGVGANSFVVLGQTIQVNSGTVFEDYASGLTSMSIGNLVEVHAFETGTPGTYTATRVEKKSTLTECKLTGLVSGLALNSSFAIGTTTVNYATVSSASPTLSNGLRVRVRLGFNSGSNDCTTTATKIRTATLSLPESAQAELEGTVSDYSSLTSFKVDGFSVQAPNNTTTLGNGLRVEVEGTVQNGVLVASKVTLKNPSGGDEMRLFGSPVNHNMADKTFELKGVAVQYGDLTELDGVTPADFDGSKSLEVRGTLNATGTSVEATKIKLAN